MTQEDVWRHGSEAKGVKEAVFEVATRANDELETARSEWRWKEEGKEKEEKIPKEVMPVFLSAVSLKGEKKGKENNTRPKKKWIGKMMDIGINDNSDTKRKKKPHFVFSLPPFSFLPYTIHPQKHTHTHQLPTSGPNAIIPDFSPSRRL